MQLQHMFPEIMMAPDRVSRSGRLEPALRAIAMPATPIPTATSSAAWRLPNGLARRQLATQRPGGRAATVAITGMTFYLPSSSGRGPLLRLGTRVAGPRHRPHRNWVRATSAPSGAVTCAGRLHLCRDRRQPSARADSAGERKRSPCERVELTFCLGRETARGVDCSS